MNWLRSIGLVAVRQTQRRSVKTGIIAATAWLPIVSSVLADESTATGQTAPAAEQQVADLTASVAVPVLSAYVWRGIVVSDKLVAQPNATLSKDGVSFNTWANYNFTDAYSAETEHEISEVDLTLSYSRAVGPVTLGATYAEYVYPHQTVVGADGTATAAPGTREVQVSAALSGAPLSPTLTLVRDIDEIDGFYASIALSHSFAITDKAALALGFSTGVGDSDYNVGYFGINKTELNDGNVSASLPITLTKSITVTPLLQYTWLWDSAIRDQAGAIYKDDSSLWGGVTLSVTL